MDFHICKERRNNKPESVMNCNNTSGGLGQSPDTDLSTSSAPSVRPLNLEICPTTGGVVRIDISADQTVCSLKKEVSKKLGVSQDRISLLHKERLLKDGTLIDNQITDGSRITLLPNVETGLMSSPPELSVMQALESLSEGQVNDFLTGKSPLTLAMRLGNHVMFLQLQLSTMSPSTKRSRAGNIMPSSATRGRQHRQNTPTSSPSSSSQVGGSLTSSANSPPATSTGDMRRNQLKLPTMLAPPSVMTPPASPKSPSGSYPGSYCYPSVPHPSQTVCPSQLSSVATKHLALDPANTPPPSPCYGQKLVPDLPNTATQIKEKVSTFSVAEPVNTGSAAAATAATTATTTAATKSELTGQLTACAQPEVNTAPSAPSGDKRSEKFIPFLDNNTLSKAKQSLSRKLKEYSKHSATTTTTTEKLGESSPGGAVIESMQKLGRGVYSGTFSGTLNSALQDPEGRPKRSVSTIVHILNDLLGATPPNPARHHVNSATNYHNNQDSKQNNDPERFEKEQEAIRDKVQHLQLKMEERRRKRQARRHHRAAPYPSRLRPEVGDPDAGGATHPPEDMDVV